MAFGWRLLALGKMHLLLVSAVAALGAASKTTCAAGNWMQQAMDPHSGELISTGCAPCSAGLYSDTTNQLRCKKCPMGRYSSSTAHECNICQFGQYQPKAGQSTCIVCSAPGHFAPVSLGTLPGQHQHCYICMCICMHT
jgi:hypothetical protein